MTMHTDANSFSTANSAAEYRADLLGCALHRRITSGAGLVFGEGAIGRAEPQREGQGLAVLANLRTGVHVEQPDILQQLPRAVANGVLDRLCGDVGVHDEADVLEYRGKRGNARRGERINDRDRVEIELDRAGALGQAGTLDHRRVQLPGVADHGLADEYFCAAARMPRQVLSGPQCHVNSAGAANGSHRLESIGRLGSPTFPPRSARLAQSG